MTHSCKTVRGGDGAIAQASVFGAGLLLVQPAEGGGLPDAGAGESFREYPRIQTPIEELYFASMSQVYPWDRGTNFAVEIGRRAARMMLGKQ